MKTVKTAMKSTDFTSKSMHSGSRAGERGFTLVEVLVAVTAGLMVSAAAFILARNATQFFQNEARISSAQLSAMMGIERLLSDLDRAAYLSTPNILNQNQIPKTCIGPGTPPKGLENLSALFIEEGGSINGTNPLPQSVANDMNPDRITIGGSFDNNDVFPVNLIQIGASGGYTIFLSKYSHSMTRAQAAGQKISNIFKTGRFIRLVDPQGIFEYYAEITGTDEQQLSVSTAPSPYMPQSADSGCGLGNSFHVGFVANPVTRIRYDIRSLKNNAAYNAIVKPVNPEVTGDNQRSELVRVELQANGDEIADTIELVSEYTVDLKFGLTAFTANTAAPTSLTTGACQSALGGTQYACPIPMPADVYTQLSGPLGNGASPELIRSVQVRLVTRSRAPDRETDLGTGPDGRKYRFRIDLPGFPAPKFTRLRTVYAEKYLRNQESR